MMYRMVVVRIAKVRFKGWRVELVRDRYGGDYIIWSRPPRGQRMRPRTIAAPSGDDDKTCHLAAIETLLLGQFPAIVAHLAVTRFDDFTARTPGTMMVKSMGSSWVVVLKEPDAALQMQVMGQTLDDTLALAELLLSGDKAPWEPDPWQKQRNTKSKK